MKHLLLSALTLNFFASAIPSSATDGNYVYSIASNPYIRIKWPAHNLPTTSKRVEAQILNLSPNLLEANAVSVCFQNFMTDLPDNDPRRINQVLDDTVGNSCTLLGAQHIDVNNPYSVNDSHSAISWTTLDIPDSVSDVNVTVVASLRIYDSIASQAKVNFEFTTDRKKTRENTAVFDNNNDVVMAVEKAFGLANSMISNIEAGVLEIDGMSGNKFRHFLNNLVRLVGCENYLEIGVWAGSSFCR
tara:strand:- start:126 stop:860 length:735 start_codon:yes stop_codon:yes gene_type:complete